MPATDLIHPRLLFCAAVLAAAQACAPGPAAEQGLPDAVAADATGVRPLLPGMQAPAFALRRPDGSDYRFAAGPRDKPVVITFFRGTWCPYCSRYLWAMREAEQALLDLGYELIFISADRPEVLAPYLDEKDLSYQLLSDNDLVAARAFGIAFKVDPDYIDKLLEHDIDIEAASGRTHRWLPVPATFVIGTDGVIDFMYANPDYKTRVAPDVLVAAARVGVAEQS